MRGEEITTYGGHANAWGLPVNTLVDFRVRPGDRAGMSEITAQAHQRRALISINHPFALCSGCAWSYDQEARDFDAIEVWNGAWDPTDEQALALWDRLLQKGHRITAVASSDSHRPTSHIGEPTTHVFVKGGLTQQTILNAISAGRAYLTREPQRRLVRFDVRRSGDSSTQTIGDRLLLREPHRVRLTIAAAELPQQATISVISQGQVIRTFSSKASDAFEYVDVDCREDCYFRLEIRDKTGAMLALTNPIYVEIKNRGKTFAPQPR
jgi:hypothetical protein